MTLTGKLVSTGASVEISIADGRIKSIRKIEPNTDGIWIAPALIDIQVNGFTGYDLNAEDVTPDNVSAMIQALWRFGTGFLCPTVTTGAFDRIANSLDAILSACNDPKTNASIVCIHLEGPYLSAEDGPRGAHDKAQIRQPDWEEFQKWQEIARGRIRMVTLAPEIEGALPFIEKLARQGIVVALGHTNATKTDIDAAIRAGAKISTHLGNGAHSMIRRHPNYIWEQLAADELWASLIVDGHHLPPSVVKCMIRAKGLARCVLTSDSVSLAGMPPGRYQGKHREVELTADRCVKLVGTDYLAGSAIELARGIENSVKFAGLSLNQAVDMATIQPARLLGLDNQIGTIREGLPANLISFHWNELTSTINLLSTVHNGEIVYSHGDG